MASLDVEVTPFARCPIEVDDVSLWLEDGNVESLLEPKVASLPLVCTYGDIVTLVYRLEPVAQAVRRYTPARILDVAMHCKALVSGDCQAQITMKWRTSVDINAVLHMNSGLTGQQRTKNNPTALPGYRVDAAGAMARPDNDAESTMQSPHAPKETDRAAAGLQTQSGLIKELGILVTVSGPGEVRLGEVFRWHLFVVNRCSTHKALAFAVVPDLRRTLNAETVSTALKASLATDGSEVADAVLDERALYALHGAAVKDPVDVVCLSAAVRIRFVH
jgi:hypothetical protein